MASTKEPEENLLDYEAEDDVSGKAVGGAGAGSAEAGKDSKGHFVGVHSSSFRDFMLKPELLRSIVDFGFEHPSAVQHEAIPQAMLGMDVLCQAKSGMGKTAVFVLATLNQINTAAAAGEGHVSALILCHTRELAHQIAFEFKRFSKYMPSIKTSVVYGGKSKADNVKELAEEKPSIVVGTPGRVLDLIESGALKVDKLTQFILDECDKLVDSLDMRSTVQQIFLRTPREKQVMMFSATLSKTVKPVCLKFMDSPLEIYVESDSKLTLHGLLQYTVKLEPKAKNRKLTDLLDSLEFNQVVIFVSSGARARELDRLLKEANFPTEHVHGGMPQEERIKRYNAFRANETRILLATNLFGRGIDVEHVNVVINYDFPAADDKGGEAPADQYLHRVGRAGRFGTKGLAISFIASEADEAALAEVQKRFTVEIPELPATIDPKSYLS